MLFRSRSQGWWMRPALARPVADLQCADKPSQNRRWAGTTFEVVRGSSGVRGAGIRVRCWDLGRRFSRGLVRPAAFRGVRNGCDRRGADSRTRPPRYLLTYYAPDTIMEASYLYRSSVYACHWLTRAHLVACWDGLLTDHGNLTTTGVPWTGNRVELSFVDVGKERRKCPREGLRHTR